MKHLIILMAMFYMVTASAKSEDKTKIYRGTLEVTDQINESGSKGVRQTNTKLVVNSWAEGKVLIVFTIEDSYDYTYGCPAVSKTFVGYETAFKSYDIYPVDQTNQSPTPSTSKANGNLVISDKNAYLQLFSGLEATTVGKYTCIFRINKDQAIELRSKH